MPNPIPQPSAVADDIKHAIERLETAVVDSEAAVRAARLAVESERDQVEDLLALYSASLIAHESPVDRPLMRDIYWHHTAVRVAALAPVLGVKGANSVHKAVGPLPTDRTCEECGVTLGQASRAGGRAYWGGSRWCEPCAQLKSAEYDENWKRASAIRRREAEAAEARVNESLRDGSAPTKVLVEIEGETGLWFMNPDGSARRATDEDVFGPRH